MEGEGREIESNNSSVVVDCVATAARRQKMFSKALSVADRLAPFLTTKVTNCTMHLRFVEDIFRSRLSLVDEHLEHLQQYGFTLL